MDREDAILAVELLVDGRVVTAATSRSARPDVCAHPVAAGIAHCAISQPQATFSWNTTPFSNGAHTVAIQVTDSAGLTATVGGANVTVGTYTVKVRNGDGRRAEGLSLVITN